MTASDRDGARTGTETAPAPPRDRRDVRDMPAAAAMALSGTRTRFSRLVPFILLCVFALPLTFVLPPSPDRVSWLAAATVVMVIAAVQIVVVPWDRMAPIWRHIPSFSFCVAVVLLRQAGGGSGTGYGTILVLLPVTWQALYGRRIDLALALATVAASLSIPLLVLDGYPIRTEVPRMLLTLSVAAAVGGVFRSLIEALRANDRSLRLVVAVSRELHTADDPRATLCEGIRMLTAADAVTLYERDERGLRPNATAGAAESEPAVDQAPGRRQEVLDRGEACFEPANKPSDGGPSHGARLHLPIGPHDAPVAVVTASWATDRQAPNPRVLNALALLGIDAGRALQRADLIASLDDHAHRDRVTGLPNRRAWDQILEREIAVAHRHDRPLSIAILDLDHFKAYNDQHGHLAGDDLLREATAAWAAALRSGDILARWGGEEFAVLLPETPVTAAVRVIERLQPVTPGDQTFSAGVSQLQPYDTPDSVVATADAAMYQAKTAGRNRVVRAVPVHG